MPRGHLVKDALGADARNGPAGAARRTPL